MYRRRKVIEEEKPEIPDTIEEFGYTIKDNDEIRGTHSDMPYVFDYLPKDRPYNELRYKKFIELIGDVVEERLVAAPYNYQKVIVPVGANPETDVHSYIYMTPNAMTTTDKLLVMIPGNHTRIGQWSRRILCDENLKKGSMMEITELVQEKGYECIILNPNANFWYNGRAQEEPQIHTPKLTVVPENDSPENHCQYVFHNIIRNVKAEKIAVIAMGWGGHGFTLALNNDFDFIKQHVKAVAMLNSVHSKNMIQEEGGQRTFMINNCVNWIATDTKKGEAINDPRFGCACFSSGVEISDFTLTEMLDDMMKFIFIKMGDIEAPVDEDEDDDDENLELTRDDLEHLVLEQMD